MSLSTLDLHQSLLVKNAEVNSVVMDVRCKRGIIAQRAQSLKPLERELVIDANSCALIPSLHDHHLHLLSLATSQSSVKCGPPEVETLAELRKTLSNGSNGNWVRGVGYHESVAGDLDRKTLDAICQQRPVRIQHRSGRLWILNTLALERLGLDSKGSGQLFRMDEHLRTKIPRSEFLSWEVKNVCKQLLSMGITGVTDATPSNDKTTQQFIRNLVGEALDIEFMGNEHLECGHLKVLIDDYRLPDFDDFCRRISVAHNNDRPVAVHCTSRVELVFTLSAFKKIGAMEGDRIEHASVVEEDTLKQLVDLGLTVVTQPNFIYERGDQYASQVLLNELSSLYRVGGLLQSGLKVGGGTDAPFGSHDPWLAIRTAVNRLTRKGIIIGESEKISPERAIALFNTKPSDPGGSVRQVELGQPANLCLLSKKWREARKDLDCGLVDKTIRHGRVVFERR